MRAIYVDKVIPRIVAVKVLSPLWPNVVWSPISPVSVADLPEPDLPGPRWLRVRNLQCGICETDLSMLHLDVDISVAPAALPGNNRFYLGHEVVGKVEEVGSGVTRFKVGDRVVMESRFTGPNCHTQEIDPPCIHCVQGQTRLCENASLGKGPTGVGGGWGDGYTAHETEVFPIPDDINDDQATLIEPMAVAMHGVLRRLPREGEHVLVLGVGIIGLLTVQIAKLVAPACHLTVVARYQHQVEMARCLGADEVLMEDDLYTEIARITDARHYKAPLNRGMLLGGFEVIYDCVGSAETIIDGLRWARAGGTIVLVGISLNTVKVDLNPIWYQEVNLIGSHTFGVEDWQGSRLPTFDLVIQLLKEGALTHDGLITHRFPFDEYRRAIATQSDKRKGSIKVVFTY
jgi:threonine dehydrogenase-like Zn-dependent dehydrogenase